MTHLVVGLFKDAHQAGAAIAELKPIVAAKDISLIAKDAKTGKINIHQVKETGELTEMSGARIGAEIGGVAGVLGAISTIINPAFAPIAVVGALALAMGVTGATVGELAGSFIGSEVKSQLPPERAKLYKDKIKNGEVFVVATSSLNRQKELMPVFQHHGATDIHTMNLQD
ncbi:MAG: hypothetical protein M1609_04315 [Firmicutes bacterium]|nr:hypothetical protein [Bacillota bacterium]